MGNCSDKYEVLSSVIESLESKDTFQNIAEAILQKANAYIQAEYMAVIQENSDKDILDYIATVGETCALIERVENGEYSLEELEKVLVKVHTLMQGDVLSRLRLMGLRLCMLL